MKLKLYVSEILHVKFSYPSYYYGTQYQNKIYIYHRWNLKYVILAKMVFDLQLIELDLQSQWITFTVTKSWFTTNEKLLLNIPRTTTGPINLLTTN